jgi:hypothetical protein
VLLVGCRELTAPPLGDVTLVTNQSFYTAVRVPEGPAADNFEILISVAVANRTNREISLQACADRGNSPRFAVSMAAIANDWSSAYQSAAACESAATLTLAVGESRADGFLLSGPRTFDIEGVPLGNIEGEMRIVYYVDGIALTSNAFTVMLEPQGQ